MSVTSERDTVLDRKPSSLQDIAIISRAHDVWNVRIIFPTLEASDNEMVVRLRQAKQLIQSDYHIPIHLLELREVVGKHRTPEGIAVDVAIGRVKNEKGKPVVHLKSLESPHGGIFEDMIAEADFYWQDEFGQLITAERILVEVNRLGIKLDLCNLEALKNEIASVIKLEGFVRHFELGRGQLPEEGQDAELEYTFFSHPDGADDLKEYKESRKVRKGDVLCQKIPAKNGKKSGFDIRGDIIPGQRGLDFDLVAGVGVKLSVDGTRLTADIDGVASMVRKHREIYTVAGRKVVPEKVEVAVKPLVQVDASQIEHLITDDSVEIKGTLKKGTTINAQGEVFIEGALEEGAVVRSGGDIIIDGDISGGEVAADESISTTSGATGSKIVATNDVSMRGVADKSTVSGRRVALEGTRGSRVVASQKVTLKHTGDDADGNKSTIRVGQKEYYKEKIEAHRRALKELRQNLDKIKELFGSKLILRLTAANVQQVLIQHLQEVKKNGHAKPNEARISALKQLLESVPTMKRMIAERTREVNMLLSRQSDDDDGKKVVLIREKVNNSVNVTLGSKRTTVKPGDSGAMISEGTDGKLKNQPIKLVDKVVR